MARHLRHRLGGDDGLAVELALLEEHVEDVAGGAGQQLQQDDEGAAHVGHAGPRDVGRQALGQQVGGERDAMGDKLTLSSQA